MTQLVPILHPPTGETLYMHPDLAGQQHRWLHPDPSVPTPAESLPLFEMDELQKVVLRLTPPTLHQEQIQHMTSTSSLLKKAHSHGA